jgi:hypothetical protein
MDDVVPRGALRRSRARNGRQRNAPGRAPGRAEGRALAPWPQPTWPRSGPVEPRSVPRCCGPSPSPRHLHRRVTSGHRRDSPPPRSPRGSREALSPAAPFTGVDRLSRRRPLGGDEERGGDGGGGWRRRWLGYRPYVARRQRRRSAGEGRGSFSIIDSSR